MSNISDHRAHFWLLGSLGFFFFFGLFYDFLSCFFLNGWFLSTSCSSCCIFCLSRGCCCSSSLLCSSCCSTGFLWRCSCSVFLLSCSFSLFLWRCSCSLFLWSACHSSRNINLEIQIDINAVAATATASAIISISCIVIRVEWNSTCKLSKSKNSKNNLLHNFVVLVYNFETSFNLFSRFSNGEICKDSYSKFNSTCY